MVSALTIGGIWKNKKTGEEYELVAVNNGINKIQLAALHNGEGYNCMTEKSLRKNYTLTAFEKEEPKSTKTPTKETTTSYLTFTAGTTGFKTKEDARAFIKQAKKIHPKTSHFMVEPANKSLAQQGFSWLVREWRYIEQ